MEVDGTVTTTKNDAWILKNANKTISNAYKRKIAQELASVSLTQEKRDNINALVSEALDNMMPQEKIEETKVEENNVVCKLFLKSNPESLMNSLVPIFKSLVVRKRPSGDIDFERTGNYALTFMLEKVKDS